MRIAELEADGQVAEVIFPNTVPPFFPTGALVARPPTDEDLDLRWAGLRAHNRWLADWCGPESWRRAGIAQVFLNDVDAAVAEAEWVTQSGLTGGILVPTIPDDCDIEPLYSQVYDPLWAMCEANGLVVNSHSGSGQPDYGDHAGLHAHLGGRDRLDGPPSPLADDPRRRLRALPEPEVRAVRAGVLVGALDARLARHARTWRRRWVVPAS